MALRADRSALVPLGDEQLEVEVGSDPEVMGSRVGSVDGESAGPRVGWALVVPAGRTPRDYPPGMDTARATSATAPYAAFLDALNRQDLDAAARVVDTARYRENCVGFTPGFVGWEDATTSIRRVWQGLPDLRVDLDVVVGEADVAMAHGTVTGTNTGRLYGAPATGKSFEASYFDYVRVEDGLIVERVQQSDVLAQMRQIYGKAFGVVGLSALLWRS